MGGVDVTVDQLGLLLEGLGANVDMVKELTAELARRQATVASSSVGEGSGGNDPRSTAAERSAGAVEESKGSQGGPHDDSGKTPGKSAGGGQAKGSKGGGGSKGQEGVPVQASTPKGSAPQAAAVSPPTSASAASGGGGGTAGDVEMQSEEVEQVRAELLQRGLLQEGASAELVGRLGEALGMFETVQGKRRRKVQA